MAKEAAVIEIGQLTQKCEEEEEDRKGRELKDQEATDFKSSNINL
jgi:hypothetical protein